MALIPAIPGPRCLGLIVEPPLQPKLRYYCIINRKNNGQGDFFAFFKGDKEFFPLLWLNFLISWGGETPPQPNITSPCLSLSEQDFFQIF
jgi:hypothetical protein